MAQGMVREPLDALRDRRRAAFLNSRTTLERGMRRLRTDGKKALPTTARQRAAVTNFMQDFAEIQADPEFYGVPEVVRRIAGTSSLGVDRFAIFVRGRGSPDGNYILDLKESLPSSLLPNLKVSQPPWRTEAHRVVELQRRMQAMPMALLQPEFFNEAPHVLHALQPSEDRVRLTGSRRTRTELEGLVATLACLVAWAQLRSAGRGGSARKR